MKKPKIDNNISSESQAKIPNEKQEHKASHIKYQMILGLFGLQSFVYPFLEDEKNQGEKVIGKQQMTYISNLLNQLLEAWVDPINLTNENDIPKLKQMIPFVYDEHNK